MLSFRQQSHVWFNMASSSSKTIEGDLRKQFLTFLNQPDSCEQFYIYMKSEHLAYVLEFYLACDGLRNLLDDISKQGAIIELIYKHYLSKGKDLALSSRFSLPDELLRSIKQRLIRREFDLKFYDTAQEYVLKYMLQMCYPKFLIEQQQEKNLSNKRQATTTTTATFSPMHRRVMGLRKKDVFDQFKQQRKPSNNSNNSPVVNLSATTPTKTTAHLRPSQIDPSTLEASTLVADNEAGLNISKPPRTSKLTKQQKDQYSLAQRDPAAFFEAIKTRLLAYQAETSTVAKIRGLSQSLSVHNKGIFAFGDHRTATLVDDDSLAVLDSQIAKTIDDADNSLFETTTRASLTVNTHRHHHQRHQHTSVPSMIKNVDNKGLSGYHSTLGSFTRSDSGVGTDCSEKNYETFRSHHAATTSSSSPHARRTFSSSHSSPSIDVVWYPSLDSSNALLSTIPRIRDDLTFSEFRHLFKKQPIYRYFFKTTCPPAISKDQYVFRESTMDDELVPFYDGKIFVKLDRIS